jgi:hypothetical protein
LWWPPNPRHSFRVPPGVRASLLILAMLAPVAMVHAQGGAAAGGQGDIALQGFYLGGGGTPLLDTTGTSFRFQEFLPSVGFLDGSLEAYGSQNRFQTGENFLELRGAPWMGEHWTVTGGDFHAPPGLLELPFNNIFTPLVTGRGFQVVASHDATEYSVFYGQEMLVSGDRVSYRLSTPQTVAGVSALRRVARGLQLGVRLMQFSASDDAMSQDSSLFPAGHSASMVRTATLESLYKPRPNLKFYAQVSRAFTDAPHQVLSTLTGVSWENKDLTVRANYVRQGALYFPLAAYFAGDRQGPFAEVHYRHWKQVDLYGSASRYRNNLEQNVLLPYLHSTSSSAGLSTTLPGNFAFNGQISNIQFSQSGGGEDFYSSRNRQVSGTLSRAIHHNTLQADWRDIRIVSAQVPQTQRSTEVRDMVQLPHVSFGGAVRYQQDASSEQRNSLFFRAQAQVTARRFSAYANIEVGNDLANQTVFSTETYNTSVAGITTPIGRGWNVTGEMYRNRLNLAVNPENIFVIENGGALPAESLSAVDQWSFYFRVSRQVRWGAGLPQENLDQFVASAVPLVGAVEGVVRMKALAGPAVAAGIPVTLDGSRNSISDAEGHYRFDGVAEGQHEVALSATELPADFDRGQPDKAPVIVLPRRTARADFEVLPLGWLEGKVEGPAGTALDGIVVRIAPGNQYTMTGNDGHFAFYNLPEGDFELSVDPSTLPENAEMTSRSRVAASIRVGSQTPLTDFSFDIVLKLKPIRKVLELK